MVLDDINRVEWLERCSIGFLEPCVCRAEVSGFGWSISCYCIVRHILLMTSLKSLGSSTMMLNNKQLQISMTYVTSPTSGASGRLVAGPVWPGFGWAALRVWGPVGTTLLQAAAGAQVCFICLSFCKDCPVWGTVDCIFPSGGRCSPEE